MAIGSIQPVGLSMPGARQVDAVRPAARRPQRADDASPARAAVQSPRFETNDRVSLSVRSREAAAGRGALPARDREAARYDFHRQDGTYGLGRPAVQKAAAEARIAPR